MNQTKTICTFSLVLLLIPNFAGATRIDVLEGTFAVDVTQYGPTSWIIVAESNAAPLDLTTSASCWSDYAACGVSTSGMAGVVSPLFSGGWCATGATAGEAECFIFSYGHGHVDQRVGTEDRIFAQCVMVGSGADATYRCNELYVVTQAGETCLVRNHWGSDDPYLQSTRLICVTP